MKDGRLEASDLMIGDWVRSKKWAEKPFKLTSLNANLRYYYGITSNGVLVGPFLIEELEPIPLTKEILEKIGLRKGYAAEYYDQDIYSDEFDTFGLIEGIDGSYVFETYTDWCKRCPDGSPEDYGISTVNNIVGIKYLHELQHALKLCKIEKTIEL